MTAQQPLPHRGGRGNFIGDFAPMVDSPAMRGTLDRVVVLLAACSLAACASSSSAGQVDAGGDDQPDAAPDAPAIDAPPDAKLNGFGEPCTDTNQCESHLCIAAATGGVCSQLCGACPDGWGCFGVLGAIDPGQVAFVCVPVSTQLCSPCMNDTECTLLGMDKCLTQDTGRKYCARDCTTVSCPMGYSCDNVVVGSTNYKECVPTTGACDCMNAMQQGMTDPCSIMTALGTQCAGTATCGGTAGWGTCQPPATTDTPDAMYKDDNCDGIDGEYTKGIFVAGGGTNTATCGLTHGTPCQTISFGVVRAVQASRPNVYVQAGTYNEVIVLLNGVSVWGGYDFQWQRGPYSNNANKVTVNGAQDTTTGGDGEYMTVRAHDLIVPATIADMILVGPTAQGTAGTSGLDGRSSYVVHAKAAGVALTRVQITAGSGAPGATGTAGTDAVLVDAQSFMNGGTGGNGDEFTTVCNSSSAGGGGPAGTNSCGSSPSSRLMTGGAGGGGGTMDTDCGVFSSNFDARPGGNGGNAAFTSGSFGLRGTGGSGTDQCGIATDGNGGMIANGAGGTASSGGYLGGPSSQYWYARSGNAGGTGQNGSGGGGGGGGGGCDSGTDAYGAGGGGGGAGGCAARSGGAGGGGGGGAFGIVAVGTSTVTVDSCTLVRGVAGTGGTGGTGGRGQSGGAMGFGGSFHPGSTTPGNGGAGAHGGHGGGGGGGQGGRSVGILTTSDSSVNGTCTQSQGTGGMGGGGGASAPSAPAAERDGNNGATGAAGTNEANRTCASTSSC